MEKENVAEIQDEEVINPEEAGDEAQDSEEDTQNLEPWQEVETDEGEDPEKEGKGKGGGVPVITHIKMKEKLKGRITARDEEIERLRLENEALKSKKTGEVQQLVRPRRDDFETDEEYGNAIDDYEEKRALQRYENLEKKRAIERRAAQYKESVSRAVDEHYTRASKLVSENNIDPEVFKQSDYTVRQAIDSIVPKQGDTIIDQLISILGDGSEKVIYFLGRNQNALNNAKALLAEDPTGLKLSVYLGQQKERLTNPIKKRTSQAPDPSPTANGDGSQAASGKAKALQKRYQEAHKKGKLQEAYNAKKEAKALGVDVSKW